MALNGGLSRRESIIPFVSMQGGNEGFFWALGNSPWRFGVWGGGMGNKNGVGCWIKRRGGGGWKRHDDIYEEQSFLFRRETYSVIHQADFSFRDDAVN